MWDLIQYLTITQYWDPESKYGTNGQLRKRKTYVAHKLYYDHLNLTMAYTHSIQLLSTDIGKVTFSVTIQTCFYLHAGALIYTKMGARTVNDIVNRYPNNILPRINREIDYI